MMPRALSTWPNRVTSVRLIGTAVVAVLTTIMLIHGTTWPMQLAVATTGLVCVLLDGVDGWLARRLDQSTDFGARYDVEVDAAMVLVLSVALLVSGIGGWWVMLLGGWRYGYVLAKLKVSALRRPLPHRYSRKVIGAVVALAQIGALVLAVVGVPGLVTSGIVLVALGALSWSFLRDIIAQLGLSPSESEEVDNQPN